MKKEILDTGFSEPISVWKVGKDYKILNGHQRLATLLRLEKEGETIPKIPISLVEADNEYEAKRKVLALTSQYGVMDVDGLKEFIDGTPLDTRDIMQDFIFPELDMESFVGDRYDKPQDVDSSKDDEVPEVDETEVKVRTGDLWLLGDHRLVCGDSTDKAVVVDLLMNGEKADMVFTSPPYADQRSYNIGDFDWLSLMNSVHDNIEKVVNTETHNILINLGPSHEGGLVNWYWMPWILNRNCFGFYIWDKGFSIPGDQNGRLAPRHEFIFHFKKNKIQANKNIPKKSFKSVGSFRKKDGSTKPPYSPELSKHLKYKIPDSIIEIQKECNNRTGHPAVFPVALPEFIINTWKSTKVFDPFGGSGSTLIACEKTNRKCFMSEIDPYYCQIIINRWQSFTDKEAVKG